jgi:transposase
MSLKKNIANKLEEVKAERVMFFDESRFGTHSKIGHGWFKTGSRSRVKIKLGYKNFYLYSSTDHITGDSYSLIMPKVNYICMNEYLKFLSHEVGNKTVALIMDGAGWHKSKDLCIPENIKIIYLPPYSPELNPVERLWKYIKDNILTNKIYETLNDLEDSLCNFLNSISSQHIKDICTADYMFS